MYEYGEYERYSYIVMECLGESLSKLMKSCGNKLSLYSSVRVALDILDRLESIHMR